MTEGLWDRPTEEAQAPAKPKRAAKKDAHQVPAGTLRGVWLGATRIAGRPISVDPLAERQAREEGKPLFHTHGTHAIAVVGDESPTLVRDSTGQFVVLTDENGVKLKRVTVTKGMCPACVAGWEYNRKHGRKRWT